MWPFKKEDTGLGLDRYQLTPDEKQQVYATFDSFSTPDGRKIGHETTSGPIKRGLAAYALWRYAEEKMNAADSNPDALNRETLIGMAINAIKKAYQIHPLPIYLFDLGRYLEASGRLASADQAYRAFLEDQADYKPNEGDYVFLRNRDIPKAIVNAKDSLNQL